MVRPGDGASYVIPMAWIDPAFAKGQLNLLLREWYMHPNGQLPTFDGNFSGVNLPVHVWACWRVYKMKGVRGARGVCGWGRVFKSCCSISRGG